MHWYPTSVKVSEHLALQVINDKKATDKEQRSVVTEQKTVFSTIAASD